MLNADGALQKIFSGYVALQHRWLYIIDVGETIGPSNPFCTSGHIGR